MIFEQPNLTDDYCLHYIGYQKRLEQGETEELFDDVLCSLCYRARQSAIICHHYTNKKHLEQFKKLNIRGVKNNEIRFIL